MNSLVVYDSQFGNTQQLARAIAAELEPHGAVRLVPIRATAEIDLSDVDLLVVGGPTQGHGMSQPLRAWLDKVPSSALQGIPLATFDTRLRWPMFLSGSAARSISKALESRGAHLVAPPESFLVASSKGPLAGGELERAAGWAKALAGRLFAGAQVAEPVSHS